MSIKKRFIAGAACPKCTAQDTLRWWIENNVEMVECVDCGHLDKRTPDAVQDTEHSEQDLIGIFKPE